MFYKADKQQGSEKNAGTKRDEARESGRGCESKTREGQVARLANCL